MKEQNYEHDWDRIEQLLADGVVKLPKLLVLAGLAASAGEAQRKIAENAVSVNGENMPGV